MELLLFHFFVCLVNTFLFFKLVFFPNFFLFTAYLRIVVFARFDYLNEFVPRLLRLKEGAIRHQILLRYRLHFTFTNLTDHLIISRFHILNVGTFCTIIKHPFHLFSFANPFYNFYIFCMGLYIPIYKDTIY